MQAEMAKMKKLNQDLAQRIQAQDRAAIPDDPKAFHFEMNWHQGRSCEKN